jgi:hypothetical protein
MGQDYYKFIVSPENIKGDLSVVDYKGTPVGVYSAMTQVVSAGPSGTSILTGLSVNILLRQTAVDVGYYSPFHTFGIYTTHLSNFKSFWNYLLTRSIGGMEALNKLLRHFLLIR